MNPIPAWGMTLPSLANDFGGVGANRFVKHEIGT